MGQLFQKPSLPTQFNSHLIHLFFLLRNLDLPKDISNTITSLFLLPLHKPPSLYPIKTKLKSSYKLLSNSSTFSPVCIAVGIQGNIYISNRKQNTISVFSKTGLLLDSFPKELENHSLIKSDFFQYKTQLLTQLVFVNHGEL